VRILDGQTSGGISVEDDATGYQNAWQGIGSYETSVEQRRCMLLSLVMCIARRPLADQALRLRAFSTFKLLCLTIALHFTDFRLTPKQVVNAA